MGVSGERDTPGAPVVLIVDDEHGVRELVRAMAQTGGYDVLVAASGEEALELAEARPGPIDLLLTDVCLPGIQGPELADRITTLRPETRVLLMSGVPGAAGEGLRKPFNLGELLSAIEKALAGPAPSR